GLAPRQLRVGHLEDVPAAHLRRRPAVERLGPTAPAHDRPAQIAPDDGAARVVEPTRLADDRSRVRRSGDGTPRPARLRLDTALRHSTVTLLARLRGWSTSQPRSTATW